MLYGKHISPGTGSVAELERGGTFDSAHRYGPLIWLLTALLLTTVFLIDNFKLVRGTEGPNWDARSFYAAEFSLVADHARTGRLLLWDPWLAGGTPDFGEPQIGAASPIEILVGAIVGGTESGFRVYWLLIWFLGPLGILLLGRHLGTPPWAALIVALGFAFCGFYTGHAEHTSFLYSFSFLPWLIWRFDAALASHTLKPAAQAGALWGLSALGGYPALTILSGGAFFLWAMGRCWYHSSSEPLGVRECSARTRLTFASVALTLVLSVGTVVLAPSYFVFFKEGSGYSDRVGVRSRQEATSSNAMHPGVLATFSSPYLGGLKFPFWNPKLWWGSDGSVTNVYVGVLPFVLALFAISGRPRSGWRWWLLVVIAFFLACAVGDHLPVRGWLYDYCPPTRYFRHPGIFRAYAIFFAMVLALLGGKDLDIAIAKPSSRTWKLLSCLALFAAAAAVAAYLSVISSKDVGYLGDQVWRSNLQVVSMWFGCAAIALFGLLMPKTRKYLPVFFVVLAIADASLDIRLAQRMVSDKYFSRQTWDRLNASHNPKIDLTSNGLRRDLRPPAWVGADQNNLNLPLKAPAFYNYSTMFNRFQIDFAKHPVLLNMGIGSDRIWFAKEAAMLPPSDGVYAALVQRSEILGAPVLVVHPAKEMSKIREGSLSTAPETAKNNAISRLSSAQNLPAQVLHYSPNHLDLKVACPGDGWLLVTDRWASGWRAQVNGEPAEIFGGDFIFRAVRVRAGENKVQFYYPQPMYFALIFLSWLTLAVILVMPAIRELLPTPRTTAI